ncbi:TetR/AcrR family transcriptional regulator [Rhizobium sp. L1K21]|uniref:TetR/AcrR family transcriptional regulator n=1 Tax=Rhizobium sp. L1K21 TaxID=2954933 RepID=UPI0020929ACE|nr:TetR/AcrR family transcriptional regulator [Rhizobium sp. L1K21]MCO6186404.1 TetR/AcrR family transcriptional regulator [Rhizobium sp. L1K21]
MAMKKAERLNPRKKPHQTRSSATVDTLLEAAARILQEEGLERFNTNRIAEKAGFSVGSLYQYFPSKEAMLTALIRRERAALLEDIHATADAGRSLPFGQIVRWLVACAARHQMNNPELARQLEYAEEHLPLNDEARELNLKIVATVEQVLAENAISDAGIKARDVVALTRGIVDAAALAGESDEEAIAERAFRAVAGYIGLTSD